MATNESNVIDMTATEIETAEPSKTSFKEKMNNIFKMKSVRYGALALITAGVVAKVVVAVKETPEIETPEEEQ